MNYLQNNAIQERFKKAASFQKSAVTLIRKPSAEEIGDEVKTFVRQEDGTLRVESTNIVSYEKVFARNPGEIGNKEDGLPIFNEWLIPIETAKKNYGDQEIENLSDKFMPYRKKALIKMIELTEEVMQELEQEGSELRITVSWSEEPMVAKVGDWLSDAGYSVSDFDKNRTYELLSPA